MREGLNRMTKTKDMVHIDGSRGEGGGQVLRSALSLSAITGRPFHMTNIRAGRKRPGLGRQHLTCVEAVATICNAEVTGDLIGSQEVRFHPKKIGHGEFEFSIGTAGSTSLVLQSVLYPLLHASGRSSLVLNGGTHNPMAPPSTYLIKTLFPLLGRMGADVTLTIKRYGFYPAGGGTVKVTVQPCKLQPLVLRDRGKLLHLKVEALVSGIPEAIAEREIETVSRLLSIPDSETSIRSIRKPAGPGNVVTVTATHANVTEQFFGFGEKRRRAEAVASGVANQAKNYLEQEAPAGEYLADQLLLPVALAGSGSYRVTRLSEHTRTNRDVLQKFLDVDIRFVENAFSFDIRVDTTG